MSRMQSAVLGAALLSFPGCALGQGAVLQSGPVVPGQGAIWLRDGVIGGAPQEGATYVNSLGGASGTIALSSGLVVVNQTLEAITQPLGINSGAVATDSFVHATVTATPTVLTIGGTTILTAAQYSGLAFNASGALATNGTLVVPNTGHWTVGNRTTGAHSLTIKTASGTGVIVAAGAYAALESDGANVVDTMAGYLASPPPIGTTLPASAMFATYSNIGAGGVDDAGSLNLTSGGSINFTGTGNINLATGNITGAGSIAAAGNIVTTGSLISGVNIDATGTMNVSGAVTLAGTAGDVTAAAHGNAYIAESGTAYVADGGTLVTGTVSVDGPLSFTGAGALIIPFATPATYTATCTQGQIEFDATYLYTCVATDTWHRVLNGGTW